MIVSQTYRINIGKQTNLLEGFSPFDTSVAATLDSELLSALVARLTLRLACLSVFHGCETPHAMLQAMRACNSDEIFDVVCHFLEFGRYEPKARKPSRELQQEIVHFSRIVDLDAFEFTNKRLSNSELIPSSLKLLLEFFTVVRSRHRQWGHRVPVPKPTGVAPIERETSDGASICARGGDSDFFLRVSCSRRKSRERFVRLFKESLTYLTPFEAALAVAVYHIELGEPEGLEVSFAAATGQHMNVLEWCSGAGSGDEFTRCLTSFPRLRRVAVQPAVPTVAGIELAYVGECFVARVPGVPTVRLRETQGDLVSFAAKAASFAREFARAHDQADTMECGHLHLDRNWDVDQEIGLELGRLLCEAYEHAGKSAPFLTPMLDDDHVLVVTKPSDYEQFFSRALPGRSYELVPECSPFVRAVNGWLFSRLQAGHGKHLVLQGKNLYYLDEQIRVELFEDFAGECVTGCIFFETALLFYRAFQRHINAFFEQRGFGELHQRVNQLWSSDLAHDDKAERVKALCASLAAFTDPRQPHPELSALLDDLLRDTRRGLHQINVLEDYYEVQQRKVKHFLSVLGLPIELTTVSFNVNTLRLEVLA